MTVLIVGGGPIAQQACRLAHAAGITAVVADKDSACPAAQMADRFLCLDVTNQPLPSADVILPATEEQAVLDSLTGCHVLFDHQAWALTSSRLRTDAFLRYHDIPAPEYFPSGSEPYIVKPDRGSFGQGIWVTEDFCEVGGAVNGGFVAQEELEGDVWSALVLVQNGQTTCFPPAKLTFDDRRRRTEAACIPAPASEELTQTACRIAQAIGLTGLLEVEAIYHHGVWKVIDLNARLPVLTPDAILAETGVNVLAALCRK
jgi:pyrrolysine biosynthesis protein PylC